MILRKFLEKVSSPTLLEISASELLHMARQPASFLLLVVTDVLLQLQWQEAVQGAIRHLVLALPGGGHIATTADTDLNPGLYILKGTLTPLPDTQTPSS